MEVTVKTLDSQTKTLQIPSEITVKEFKKRIAEEMGIPIEKQRLIFQGKVLQDDKPLQEYRVDGCVVHLVEKQPPRSTRTNGQSTETTTSSTSSTTSQGNMFMGAFALPMDVMGVTQQIVQGIVQQIGAESAQANISTSSSDDGSSVNVHINLSTVLARNDARSRLGPARVHLRNVANIVNRLQNDGMLPSNSMDEDTGSSQNSSSQGEAEDNSESTSTPEDLANVLQEVVRLNDEIRPHLQRYQELLRASSRQLRPGDDSLPDLTAEALHSLSHAYHALSDVTTNFHVPDPQLNVLPSVTPIPPSIAHAHARTTPATSQSQATSSQPDTRTTVQTSSTTTSSTGGTCGTGGTSGTSGGMLSGSGILSGGGLLSGSGLLNANPNFTASSSASVPTTSTGSGSRSRPNNPPQFLGFPLNLRNLPNLAVQFNPSAGNITIAHIMTTAAVDEASLRATTTTTNSTPTPRTSSRGSDPIPAGIGTTTGSNVPPGAEPMDDSTSDQSTSSTPSTSTSSSNPNNQSESRRTNGSNTVLNFPRQNIAHRDPLLPCQSFHFASLNQQFNARTATSQSSSVTRETTRESTVEQQPEQQEIQQQETQAESEQTQQQQQQQQQQQKQQREQRQQEQQQQQQQQSQEQKLESNEQQGQAQAQQEPPPHRPIPMFNPEDVPDVEMLRRLLNVGQRAAADAAARTPGGQDPSEFSQFSVPPSSTFQRVGPVRDRSNDIVVDFARRIAERDRNMTPEQQALRRSAAIRTAAQNTGGTVEPYTMTRAVTREFLREDLLDGAEATPANLQRATEKILEELHETFNGAFTQCKVKDGIDAPATLLTYLRPRIRRILEVVNSSESDADYAAEMAQTLSRGSVELLGLTEYCLQDGIVGLESALRTSLRNSLALAELEPELREMAIDTTWTCVRDLRNSMRVRDSTLLPYVVRKEKRDSGAKKRKESPKPERKEVKKDEIPETGAASSTPLTNNTTSESHEVAMETDEKWKKVIPAEWVPVISQDIIRQRRLPRQAPFSDAYINGMPSKRRKVMEPKEPVPYNQCMSATLKRSIAKAGVTPKTDLEKVNKEANSSPLLEKVFEQEVKNEVRERLSNDTDYNSERFPSIHNYFEKDKR